MKSFIIYLLFILYFTACSSSFYPPERIQYSIESIIKNPHDIDSIFKVDSLFFQSNPQNFKDEIDKIFNCFSRDYRYSPCSSKSYKHKDGTQSVFLIYKSGNSNCNNTVLQFNFSIDKNNKYTFEGFLTYYYGVNDVINYR